MFRFPDINPMSVSTVILRLRKVEFIKLITVQLLQPRLTDKIFHSCGSYSFLKESNMYIQNETDLWSYWIICRRTIVDHYDCYSLNLWNILKGGRGWSSPNVMTC